MIGLYWVAALGLLAVTYGIPMPQPQSRSQGLLAGVFIPADAFKTLQDKANTNDANNHQPNSNQIYQQNTIQPQPNTNIYGPNTNIPTPQQSYQPVNTNQPQYANVYQPAPNNQQVLTIQPQTTNSQPVVTDRNSGTNPNQPSVILTNQSPQPSPQILYVQSQSQPAPQTILVPQSSQPVQQQSYVLQSGQPNNLIVSNPNVNPAPNSGTVYTLIPLNTQNSNSNSGSYLIPIKAAESNPIVVKSGN